MDGVGEAAHADVPAVGGHRVLREIVRADREEVGVRREAVGEQGRGRHLDHDADLERRRPSPAPSSTRRVRRAGSSSTRRDHREHHPERMVGGHAEDRAQLRCRGAPAAPDRAGCRARRGTGSARAAVSQVGERLVGADVERADHERPPAERLRASRGTRPPARRSSGIADPPMNRNSVRNSPTPSAPGRDGAGPPRRASRCSRRPRSSCRRPSRRVRGRRLRLADPPRRARRAAWSAAVDAASASGYRVGSPRGPVDDDGVPSASASSASPGADHGRDAQRTCEHRRVRRRAAGGCRDARGDGGIETGGVGGREVGGDEHPRRRRARDAGGTPSRCASTWRPTLRRSAARARRYSSSRPSQSSRRAARSRRASPRGGDRRRRPPRAGRRQQRVVAEEEQVRVEDLGLVRAGAVGDSARWRRDVVPSLLERGSSAAGLVGDGACRRRRGRSQLRDAEPARRSDRRCPATREAVGHTGRVRAGAVGPAPGNGAAARRASSKLRAASARDRLQRRGGLRPRGRRPRSRGPASRRAWRPRSGCAASAGPAAVRQVADGHCGVERRRRLHEPRSGPSMQPVARCRRSAGSTTPAPPRRRRRLGRRGLRRRRRGGRSCRRARRVLPARRGRAGRRASP